MRLTRPLTRWLPYLACVVLAVAGCGGDPGETADAGGTALVRTAEVDRFGTVLVDANGKALYTNEAENDGKIKCVDQCADFWPPLEATSNVPASINGVDGKLGVVERPGGKRQVTLDGRPLYTFAEDKTPGMVRGDGFEDEFQGSHFVWHVVKTSGSAPGGPPAETTDDGGYSY